MPIESQFVNMLSDHLSAEVALGTVTSVREAVTWLSYTYLYVRMCRNPLAYGIPFEQKEHDRSLYAWRTELIEGMARRLDKCRMVRFHQASGSLDATELGRTASHFYLSVGTIETFDEMMGMQNSEADILHMFAHAAEFSNIKVREEDGDGWLEASRDPISHAPHSHIQVREEEMEEMDNLHAQVELLVKGGLGDKAGKTNVSCRRTSRASPSRRSPSPPT